MMRRLWLPGAFVALALAACEDPDPLAGVRAACADAGSESEARAEACGNLLESGALSDAERSLALSSRGGALYEAGDVEGANADFRAALELDEANTAALIGRATILKESGQLDAAEPMIRRLIERGAELGRAHALAGDIALIRGDMGGAVAAYDQALAADRRNALALAGRARAKQAIADFAGALADYSAALQLNPQLAPAYAGRCWVRVSQEDGDTAAARRDADEAVSIDARNVQAQLCRGLLQLRAEEWSAARDSYDAALLVEPGNPQALFGRGVARRRGGDRAGSEDLNLARDFDRHINEQFDMWGVKTY